MSSLRDKLNIVQTTKKTSNKKSSIQDKLHKLMYNAIEQAVLNDKELSKYYHQNVTLDTFKQEKNNEVSLTEIRTENVVAIPIDEVKLNDGEKIHTINKALKIGVVQIYFKGIKNNVAEYVKTPK